MKSVIIALCAVSCVYAAAIIEKDAQVLKNSYEILYDGSFQSEFETENGISSKLEGTLKLDGQDKVILVFAGSNQYLTPEGQVMDLTYVADENGYQPKADYLPTPPPTEALPAYVSRALEYIASHPYKEVNQLKA